jgi:N-acetylmuramoyl-L-alanine amidase
MRICISSGHGKYIRGASGTPVPPYLDEVNEARLVVEEVATVLRSLGVETTTFHDDVSKNQSDNLNWIVNHHNQAGPHDYDISVHFNAYQQGTKPMGAEVLYKTQDKLAKKVVDKICTASGLLNRGAKYRGDLKFLNSTAMPAILLEVCFVDSTADAELYRESFAPICIAIAEGISGQTVGAELPGLPEKPDVPGEVLFSASGTCSTFGGPADTGVSPSEGLAMWYEPSECPWLMLGKQPSGTTGMARRLDPSVFYIACRWDYDVTPKTMLRESMRMALVTNKKTGVARLAFVADWGPHEEQTGRAADLSPALAESLGVSTDDQVTVIYPYGG